MSADFEVGPEKSAIEARRNHLVTIFSLVLGAGVFVLVLFWVTTASVHRTNVVPPPSVATPIGPYPVSPTVLPPRSPGVKMGNEMGRADFDMVRKLNLADEADPAICIYNAASAMDEPEMAVLTNKRISYVKEGRITPMELSEIATILDHRKYVEKYQQNGYASDQFNIEIKGKTGARMRIVIRPGIDGPSFYEALTDAWKAAGGGETAPEAATTPAP